MKQTFRRAAFNKKCNNTVSVMICTGANFVKKNSCLVARIVLFDTASVHLHSVTLSHVSH